MNNSMNDLIADETINRYLKAILEANEKINLTRVTDLEEAKLLHIEDSLTVLDEIDDSPEGDYADIGSGGGFPGVPLGIATGRQTLLVDSVKKKMKAVEEVLTDLGLSDRINTCGSRIEELAQERPESFAVITARALSKLSVLMELASPLLKKGGRLIALKSHVDEDELSKAKSLQDKLGMKLVSNRDFYLSDGETFRSVYVFEKFKKPSIKLPRRNGDAQKKPL